MKILVLGYFGYETNQIDGQTIKTRDVYTLLKNNSNEEINFFDTQSFQKTKFNLVNLFLALFKADVVFYLPAHNNLKFIFPIIYTVAKLNRTKINYLVVGGWLVEFLKKNPLHKYLLSKINGIYVETNTLYSGLKNHSFTNIHKLHNFRITDYPIIELNNKSYSTICLVFMARVHPLKGINLLFKLEEKINKAGIENVFIDIYGPVFKGYEDDFVSKLKNSSIKYCGVLEPSEIYDVLQNYDLMLFPTKYYTEGFPGTILDAYISGLPVVATKWLNAEEFIDHGKTGFIVPFDNKEEFIQQVIDIIKNPEIITELKKYALLKREEYSADSAWGILKKSIYNV